MIVIVIVVVAAVVVAVVLVSTHCFAFAGCLPLLALI